MAPLFPRSGPGESSSPTSAVLLRCYDFPPRIPGHLFVSLPGPTLTSSFVSRGFCSRSRKVEGRLPGQGRCSAGDPLAGLPSRGRERDPPGSQAIRPVPLPRSKTPAEPTFPRPLAGPPALPPLLQQRRLQRVRNFGATARLQHLLLTLQEWRYHHPRKGCFRLAGLPLPGGSRTPWIATKGFRLHPRPPFLDFPGAMKKFSCRQRSNMR